MSFDKFMKDIVEREDAAKHRAKTLSESESEEVHPQRQIRQRYQELPQNRTRWSTRHE
jgi:hypothetical protein